LLLLPVNGIICLDKPQNMTSFACCAYFRRLLGIKKVGHAGTLDPMATGVLPILVGRATRALDLLPVQDKRYTATLRLGLISDTQDIWGSVSATGCALPSLDDIKKALPKFRGNILQIPPMMSALKREGVRLYDLARKGIEVERDPRPVTVYSLELIDYNKETGEIILDCHCSKGTYIRTICADLGNLLGCGGVMTSLRRTMSSGYTLNESVTMEKAQELHQNGSLEQLVKPVDSIFSSYGSITISAAQSVRFKNGGALSLDRLRRSISDITRVYSPDGEFLGLGKPENNEMKVLKLF
jgi:tRNA pseudouridine55 synthase